MHTKKKSITSDEYCIVVLRNSTGFPDIAQRVLAVFRNMSRSAEVNSQMGAVG
jgi:hypothetical protein